MNLAEISRAFDEAEADLKALIKSSSTEELEDAISGIRKLIKKAERGSWKAASLGAVGFMCMTTVACRKGLHEKTCCLDDPASREIMG